MLGENSLPMSPMAGIKVAAATTTYEAIEFAKALKETLGMAGEFVEGVMDGFRVAGEDEDICVAAREKEISVVMIGDRNTLYWSLESACTE